MGRLGDMPIYCFFPFVAQFLASPLTDLTAYHLSRNNARASHRISQGAQPISHSVNQSYNKPDGEIEAAIIESVDEPFNERVTNSLGGAVIRSATHGAMPRLARGLVGWLEV